MEWAASVPSTRGRVLEHRYHDYVGPLDDHSEAVISPARVMSATCSVGKMDGCAATVRR